MKMSDLIIPGLVVAAFLLLQKQSPANGPGAPALEVGGYLPCHPRAAGGVFELNVPEGSAWKIKGPFGFFGPTGDRFDAAWTPIPGRQACIESNVCVSGESTVYLRGPSGEERTYPISGVYPNCVVAITW